MVLDEFVFFFLWGVGVRWYEKGYGYSWEGNQQASSDGKHFLLASVSFTILSVLQGSKSYCNHPKYKTIINKDLLIMTNYHKKKLNLGKR